MNLEEQLPTHVISCKLGKNEIIKTYFLSEEALLMLTSTDFLKTVIFDPKYEENSEFAQALAHLAYRNLKFSRKVAKILLKSISYSNND